MDRKYC